MGYHLEGRHLEVCNCNVLCPCLIGQDADYDNCDAVVAWHFDKGMIEGVDVSGTTIAAIARIPDNVLKGNWRAAVYVGDDATDEQMQALLKVYTGELGGPVADLVKLVGEVVSVERAPIGFDVEDGRGTLSIGEAVYAELEPFTGPNGGNTTISDTIFSTVPGSPVFIGKAPRYHAKHPALGIDLDLSGHNALQSVFVFHA